MTDTADPREAAVFDSLPIERVAVHVAGGTNPCDDQCAVLHVRAATSSTSTDTLIESVMTSMEYLAEENGFGQLTERDREMIRAAVATTQAEARVALLQDDKETPTPPDAGSVATGEGERLDVQDADIQAWRDFTMALAEGKVNRDILAREAFAWGWNAALAASRRGNRRAVEVRGESGMNSLDAQIAALEYLTPSTR